MQLMKVRSVEGRMIPYLDRDGRVWGGRFVGYVDRATRSEEPVEVHVCDYYREAVERGDLEVET